MARAPQTVPEWAIGCMDRAYIRQADGERDRSIAIWIQTESQYFDLRIRDDRPSFAKHRSLADFAPDELRELARQSGDTGVCTIENKVATWASWGGRFGFYCNDVAMFPDDGRLDPKGRILYEYDTIKSPVRYEEAWVQQPYDHGLVAHLTLVDERRLDQVFGVLVVTGRYAGFVETSTSESGATLDEQLDEIGGAPARMVKILDCEASFAVRSGSERRT
jgi:hypothetical protein